MLTAKHKRGLHFLAFSLFSFIATSASAQYLPTTGGTVTGNVSVLQGRITTNEIAITDPNGGDDSDPYRLRKVNGGSNNNWLELQLNDDNEESFRIYGHSCGGFGCGQYSGNLYHKFDASGNAFHAGNFQVDGVSFFAGNVGIGTNNPNRGKFQVEGGNIHVQGTPGFNAGNADFAIRTSNGNGYWDFATSEAQNGQFIMYDAVNNRYPMRIDVGTPTNTLSLKSNGNIGIGTDAPGIYKLAVEGTVGVRKIVVTQSPNWADYVFNRGYKLMALPKLETYIKVNKHLPEIPSAKAIAQDGLDLAETQKLMMQKIEELTLYIIEQDKQIKQLKKTVVQLQKRR